MVKLVSSPEFPFGPPHLYVLIILQITAWDAPQAVIFYRPSCVPVKVFLARFVEYNGSNADDGVFIKYIPALLAG